MSNSRVALVSLAFRKLDKNGDGKVTPEDLVGVFNVKKHPKYLNGDWSEKQIIQSFLETFQIGQHRDSTVSQSLHKTLGLGFGSLFYFIFSGDIWRVPLVLRWSLCQYRFGRLFWRHDAQFMENLRVLNAKKTWCVKRFKPSRRRGHINRPSLSHHIIIQISYYLNLIKKDESQKVYLIHLKNSQ